MTQPRAFRAGQVDVESNGEFVLAIAPDPNAKSYDPPNHLVVYHTLRQ